MFSNELFNVRVVMRDNSPWFVAKDVAECIGYNISSINKMCGLCRAKDRAVMSASSFDSDVLSESGNARVTLVSESGLYRILGKCNLPKCERFEEWVFDEVLPSIRQKGYYAIQERIQEQEKEDTTQNTLPAVSKEDHLFLNILHAESKEETVLAIKDYKTYRDDIQREIEQERDEAVKKRKAINDKRTATLMVAKREDNKKINQLTCENTELKEQNEILKVSLGESNQWMSSAQLIQNFKLHRISGKDVKPRTLTTMLKKCGCRHRESEFPDAKGFKYAIFFVEDVKKALNIF